MKRTERHSVFRDSSIKLFCSRKDGSRNDTGTPRPTPTLDVVRKKGFAQLSLLHQSHERQTVAAPDLKILNRFGFKYLFGA